MGKILVRFMCCQREVDPDTLLGQDGEGFVVCSVHKERRYGWRSAPMYGHLVNNPEGKPETIYRPNYGISAIDADRAFWTDVVERASRTEGYGA